MGHVSLGHRVSSRVVIATPVRGANLWASSVSVGYAESVRAICEEYGAQTISAVVSFSSEPVRANNRLVGLFLREFPKADYLLHWDDDQWPEDRRVLGEMMATGEDVISAPYTNKRHPMRWIHELWDPCPEPVGALLDVRAVGMGFTLTSRHCLERMTDHYRKYTDYPSPHKVADLFGHVYEKMTGSDDPEDEGLRSDDISFCKRWRDIGGRIKLFLAAGIICHAGGHNWSARDMPGGIVK